MTTRQEIQIAQDLIRFVNIMNDLLDCASYILREKNPQTGEKYQMQVPKKIGDISSPVFRDATLEELKKNVERTGQNIMWFY